MNIIEQTYPQPVKQIAVPPALLGRGFKVSFEPLFETKIIRTQIKQAPAPVRKHTLSDLIHEWKQSPCQEKEDWADAFEFSDIPEKDDVIF